MVEKKKFLLGKSEQRNSCMYVEVLLKRLHLSSNIKGFCPQIKRSVMKLFYLEIRFESRVRRKTPKQVPNSVHSQYRQNLYQTVTLHLRNGQLTTYNTLQLYNSYNYIIIITCDLHPFLQSFLLYECVSSPKVSYSVP